jgi:imidazolonepropionase-like amidohydrolase
LLLAAGVTTARTAGAEAPQIDLNLKERLDSGRVPGPRLAVTGAYLNGASGGFLGDTVVSTPEQARATVAFWGSLGATSMKVYSAIAPNVLKAAVEEAESRGMHVAGHLGDISCTEAANAGIHTIEHSLTSCAKDLGVAPDAIGSFRYRSSDERTRQLIRLLVAKNIAVVATPTATDFLNATAEELSMLSRDQKDRYDDYARNRPPFLPSSSAMANWNAAHRAFERDFVAAGGRLLIGGDASDLGVVPGFANHRAIIALVKAGFTPLQVIKFATSDAAAFLKIGDRGTAAERMAADLLIVQGAPDRRIEDIRNVRYVFKDGRAYDPAKLREAAKGQLGQH